MPCCKVGASCQLFFTKEQRKALKGKPDGNLLVDFSLYATLVLPVIFLLQAFTIT